MKTILVLTPRFPYPVIGGDRLRIYELCKELSKKYRITLVSLCDSHQELHMEIPDDGVFKDVHRIYLPRWRSYLNCILALPTKKPLQIAYYHSKKFARLVETLAEKHDVIIPHLIRAAEYAKNLDNRKIIEMTDAISMNYSRFSERKNSSGLKGFIYCIEQERLNRYEKKIAEYYDYSVFVSQYDKDFLYNDLPLLYNKALVCSNGVDLSKLPYNFSPESKKLVFIGNMYSAQNYDAAYWFATEVLPILREYGEYEFHIIGRIPQASQKRFAQVEGVFATGSVDSVAEHAHGSIAGICSVRLAAGVQNKTLEYMALGIPTVTSSIGLEGLFATPNESILVADTPSEYVEAILKLESDPDFAKSLSLKALSYVKDHHSWSGKLRPLIEKIEELIN
ncbi:glycosyltransferase family 4 protein [Salinivibrio kushneri]|uniref:glycosyltransferase family 4 protein n=1 Tax=Salinivibrio kushneri TaxID=1908198 RepID=UPI0009849DF7|nr:glycosyltransferase family 4 protein [Salinivibrio kushneri]OOE62362.1 glycosyl transferase family 1 [Salinivibrio kushneri]